MKYDLSTVIYNAQRKSMTVTEDPSSGPWTAAAALSQAILFETEENKGNKLQRFALWLKLSDHVNPSDIQSDTDSVSGTNYTVEELNLLKAASLAAYPALIAGQLVKILEK